MEGQEEEKSHHLLTFGGPLAQYFMKFPNKLFKGPIECCHVDPTNDQVLQQRLSCSAFEYPLNLLPDEKHFGPGLEGAMVGLKDKGCMSTDMSRACAAKIWTYIGHKMSPSSIVNIISIETEHYKVIDKINDEILEEIEENKAFFPVYEASRCKILYKTRDYTDIHVIGSDIVQSLFTELLTAASGLLSSCYCSGEAGCPNCVQNLACHEYNEVLHKGAALIIKGVLDAEQSNLNKNVDSPTA